MTKENEKKVLGEINIHKRARELASRILEMKKQKRGIDAAILKVEKELEKYMIMLMLIVWRGKWECCAQKD